MRTRASIICNTNILAMTRTLCHGLHAVADQFAEDDLVDVDDSVEEPEFELPVDKFAEELERMMIAGHSIVSIRRWAKASYRVEEDVLTRIQDMIRRSWALESQTLHQTKARRDALRLKYLEVFERAMYQDKFIPAVKALDSIAKLDGLMSPDVNLTQINVGEVAQAPGQTQITNGVRDRIAQLSETMRLRSEQRAIQNSKIIDLHESKKGVG